MKLKYALAPRSVFAEIIALGVEVGDGIENF
jgi:hypothetical protein